MKTFFAVTIAFAFSQTLSFAHEGHNKTPGAIAAPHGGIVQGTNHNGVRLRRKL